MYYNFSSLQNDYSYCLVRPFSLSSVATVIPFLEPSSYVDNISSTQSKQRYNEIPSKPKQLASNPSKKNFIQKIYEIKTVQPIIFSTISKDGKDHSPIFKVSLKLNSVFIAHEYIGTGMTSPL
jgi:hypothetical protein